MKLKKLIFVTITLGLFFLFAAASAGEITTSSLEDAMANYPYYATITASGKGEFSLYSFEDGTNGFPKGLKLAKNGNVYGVPETAGTYTFKVAHSENGDDTVKLISLRVKPFNPSILKKGGEDKDILGNGTLNLSGLANAINGGEVALNNAKVYYHTGKGLLYEADFESPKSKLMYPYAAYTDLASYEDNIYYYHRYLDSTNANGEKLYVQRIMQDPNEGKRKALANFSEKAVSNLVVTDTGVFFLNSDKTDHISYTLIKNPKLYERRFYFESTLLKPQSFAILDGEIYILSSDKKLYKAYLDGEIASKLSDTKVKTFTITKHKNKAVIYFTDEKNALYKMDGDGQNIERVEKYFALSLNSDGERIYFSDSKNKKKLSSISLSDSKEIKVHGTVAVSGIYVFEDALIAKKSGGTQFYIFDTEAKENPVQINKK